MGLNFRQLSPRDLVIFIDRDGPPPTEASAARHDPQGQPRTGDYGEVMEVGKTTARVRWRFGSTTDVPLHLLWRDRAGMGPSHRYRISFEIIVHEPVNVGTPTYIVVTGGGPEKAVHLATMAYCRERGDRYVPWAVHVEDFGIDSEVRDGDLFDRQES